LKTLHQYLTTRPQNPLKKKQSINRHMRKNRPNSLLFGT
jgi:hypothetical protein